MAATLSITGITPAASVQGVGAGFASMLADTTKMSTIVEGIITLTGSYVSGGDPLTIVSSTVGLPFQFGNLAPHFVHIEELATLGTAVPGFQYVYAYGPTLAAPTQNGGGVQIFGSGAGSGQGGTQLSAGAYSGATPSLNNVQLKFFALFSNGI